MPERVPIKMPDGKIYLFPHDVTDDELIQFTEANFPHQPAMPSHKPQVDTEVDSTLGESMIGEESGETAPPLMPSHRATQTFREGLKEMERGLASPATAADTLYAFGRGEGTDLERALSGVQPAPAPQIPDLGPYIADIDAELKKEAARAVLSPVDFAKDIGTVLTAPSGAFNVAFGGQPESMGAEDPLFARALERGTAQALSFIPALAGTLMAEVERGIAPGREQFTTPSGWPEEMQRVSADIAERVQEIDTGARTIFDVKDPSQTSEFIANVFAEQTPIILGLVGATTLGGPGALIPAAAGLETGSIAQEMQLKRGEVDEQAALTGGLVAGALEALPIMAWLKRTGPVGRRAHHWIANRALSMMAQAPEEAGTEYAQTIVEGLAVDWLAQNRHRLSQADWRSALDVIRETQGEAAASAVTGLIVGGPFGAVAPAGMTAEQQRAQREVEFKRFLAQKQAAAKIAEEGTGERVFGAVARAAEETGLPPLGAPEEVVGGPRVPMFEQMREIEEGPRRPPEAPPTTPEAPPGSPGAAPRPPGAAPPSGAAAEGVAPEGEVVEGFPLPEGDWTLEETDEGFLVEGQQSTIYEIRKGGDQVGTAQLRLNPAGDVVIVDHVEALEGYSPGVVGLRQLVPIVRELFPSAEFIAGQTTTAEQRAAGELGEWVTRRLRPKKPAELPPTTEAEETEEGVGAAPEGEIEGEEAPTEPGKPEVMEVDEEAFEKARQSYSAGSDHIPAGKARKPVKMLGGLYISTGGSSIGGGRGTVEMYEIVPLEEFEARFPGVASTYYEKDFEAQRGDPRGFYHGMTIRRGKNRWVLVGPKIVVRRKGEPEFPAEVTPVEPTAEVAPIREMLNPDWTFDEFSKNMTRILDDIELSDEDLVELDNFLDPDSSNPWKGELTVEQAPTYDEIAKRIYDMMSERGIGEEKPPGPPTPTEETEEEAAVRLEQQLTTDANIIEGMLDPVEGAVPGELASRYIREFELEGDVAAEMPRRVAAALQKLQAEDRAVAVQEEAGGVRMTVWLAAPKKKGRAKAAPKKKPKGPTEEERYPWGPPETQPKKTADRVIEATEEEASAVASARGEPQSDGFTAAQRRWIVDSLAKVKDTPEPKEPGPTHYAIEMRVPGDGTFHFASGDAANEFRKVAKKKTTVGGTGPRIMKKKGPLKPGPLPYSTKGGWEDGITIEGTDAITDGHALILKLDPKAPAKIRNRIDATKMDPDEKKLQAKDIDRVIKAAGEAHDVIRVRSLVWPNPHEFTIKGEYEVILETDKGTRITDRTLSFDKMRFLEEATGADEMRTKLRKGDYGVVAFYREGELVGVLMPARDAKYHTGEPVPAAEEAEGETPAGEGTKASTDRFRAFHQDNGYQGSGGGALAAPAPPTLKVLGVGLPELVKLAKSLGKGKFPRVRRVLNRNPGILGFFRFRGAGSPYIALKAAIFQEPEQAAAVLAHEIGHWVDYVPDRTFARGNLLGRLMSVVRYLKQTASMNPAIQERGEGWITPEDRKRIMDEAKASTREEYWEEVAEVIRQELGITVDDILNIWRQYEPDAPKELIDYIKGLSSAQKVAIVKQAMQGLVAPELDRFKRTIETPTGKVRRVKKVRYVDVQKKFRELLIAEMRKRQIVEATEIRNELWELSVYWRPLPINPSRRHLEYRQGGDEIYADAVSAFLNDPATFQRIAPRSFQMFLNYLHRKQQFYDDWQMLQQVADDPEALNRMRASDYEEMIARGERSRAQDLKERLGIGLGFKRYRATIGEALASGLVDRNEAWYRLRRKRLKNPEDETWHLENDPIYWIEELAYANAAYAYYLDRWQAEVMKPLEEMGVDPIRLGVILGLRRAGRTRARGGRKELANPLGIGDKYARDTLAQYLADKGLTTADKRLVVEALQRWQAIREEVISEIEKSGMFPASLTKHMRESVGAYATFKVRAYIDDPDPHVGQALGYIHRQIGTLSEIGNPAIETILKDIALARAAHRTQAIRAMISQLQDTEPDAIRPAFQKKVRGIKTAFPPPPEGMRLITYLQNGGVRGIYMRHEYAKALERRETGTAYTFYRIATTPVRAVMVTHNPFWAISNVERDFRAMLKQATPGDPVTAILRAAYWTLTSAPEAFRDTARGSATLRRFGWMYEKLTGKKFDGSARIVREMMKDRALIQTGMRFYTAADISEDEAAAMLFQTYGLAEADHRTMVRKAFGTLAGILSGPGQFSERLVKIAGYRMLKANQEKLGLSDKEVAHLVRTRVGTPDIMRRGDWHNFTNSVFLFSNVAKEGYRAAWESWEQDPLGYTAKLITYDVLPTVVKWMAASGFLGAALKGLFDRIPEYDKRTYGIIPIGLTTSGKAVYIVLPHDHIGQLVASSVWGVLQRNETVRQEIAWEAAQNLPWSHGQFHPFVESTLQWAQYASGVNPSDWYRGRPVIPDKVWEADDIWAKRRYMLGNTLDNLGLRVLTDLTKLQDENGDVDPQTVADWLQKGTGWPVAGSFLRRFIRVSDRGISEEGFRRFREAEKGPNQARINRDAVLKEVLELNPNADGWEALAELERRGVDPAYKYEKEKELVKKLDTRLDTLRLRYHGTEYDRLRSYANTEDREAIVEQLRREIEGKEGEE